MRSKRAPASRRTSTPYSWRYLNGMTEAELLRVSEANLQAAIVAYLQEEHPNVLFKCDTSAIKLTIGQAAKMKRLGNTRAWPDLFIAKPAHNYHGAFFEIKKDGEKILKDNGEYATAHLREQGEILDRLGGEGYRAQFVIG